MILPDSDAPIHSMQIRWQPEEILSLNPDTPLGSFIDGDMELVDFLQKSDDLGFSTQWDEQWGGTAGFPVEEILE